MTDKTQLLLSEKQIYVSWGILILAIACTYMVAQTMAKIDQLTPIITEVQILNTRVTKVETELTWLNQMYDKEVVNQPVKNN